MFTEDLVAFFDLTGFADMHNVGGNSVACIVGAKQSARSEHDQTWFNGFDVAVKRSDITVPAQWDNITFDGTSYMVAAVHDDGSVVTLTLATPHDGDMLHLIR